MRPTRAKLSRSNLSQLVFLNCNSDLKSNRQWLDLYGSCVALTKYKLKNKLHFAAAVGRLCCGLFNGRQLVRASVIFTRFSINCLNYSIFSIPFVF
jgi:hypothetical protein